MERDEGQAQTINRALDMAVRFAALGLLAAWCLTLLFPFVPMILWGGVLAVALHPVFTFLTRLLGGREGVAATVITIAALALILGPVSVLATSFVSGMEALASAFAEGRLTPPPPPEALKDAPFIGERLFQIWALAAINLTSALNQIAPMLGDVAGRLLRLAGAAGLTVLQFAAASVIAGALMPRAAVANAGLSRLIDRLAPARGAEFVMLAAHTVRNVARGVIGVALLQGLLIGAAFLLVGLPLAGLWTFVAIALAIVQIGVAPVALGAIVYAWQYFDTTTALLFTVWLVAVGLIDNVLKPILMARGLPTPMVVIVLGLLGGTLAHGLLGLFVGPVVLAVGYDLMRVWIGTASARDGAQD